MPYRAVVRRPFVHKLIAPLALGAFAASLPAQTPAPPTQSQTEKPASRTLADIVAASTPTDWRPLDLENTLYLELPTGRVIIELNPDFAPQHVDNIKALIREGYFDGLFVIRSQDNYVVQWGDPEEGDKARKVKTAKTSLPPEFTVAMPQEALEQIKARTNNKANKQKTKTPPASPDNSGGTPPFTRLPDADGYAPQVGFSNSFPAARDPKTARTWLCHCYGAVGVGRDAAEDSGSGSSLYAVIGHAPRHLDRNITVVGRVMRGIELLSTLPRGTATLGFYEKADQRLPITAIRIASDVLPNERTDLEVLRTDTPIFQELVESRRNRRDSWFKVPAGHVELCNVPIPVRLRPQPNQNPQSLEEQSLQ